MSSPGWPDGVGYRWIIALTIPTQSWLQPVIEELGLPVSIAQRPSPMVQVASGALDLQERLRAATVDGAGLMGTDGAITREVAIVALHKVADEYGSSEARDYERWIRSHVVDDVSALWAWHLVLLWFIAVPNRPAPEALRQCRNALAPILEGSVTERITRLSPPLTLGEAAEGKSLSGVAADVIEAIERQQTLEALRVIRLVSDEQEVMQITQWASEVSADLRITERLRQSRQLRGWLDGTTEARTIASVLDMPIPRTMPRDDSI